MPKPGFGKLRKQRNNSAYIYRRNRIDRLEKENRELIEKLKKQQSD